MSAWHSYGHNSRALCFLVFMANKGSINFHNTIARTEINRIIATHGLTNTMGHEPCGFIGDLKRTVKPVVLIFSRKINGL